MGTTTREKTKLWSFRDTAMKFGLKPGPGTNVVAELVRIHGLAPIELGQAKGLDIEDIKVIAKALGKTTEAFY